MASPISRHPPLQYEPQGRFWHCSAIVDGKQYTYGGHCGAGTSPPFPITVDIFDFVAEKWQQTPTSGEPPPGYCGASCAVIGERLFHFGGVDESGRYYNTIHQFDTRVLRWNPVTTTNSLEAPAAKYNAGMLSYHDNFVISGGYGYAQDKRLAGRECVPDPICEGMGWTNELHCFHVDSSELC